jgi:predicted amidophosphoribosyltransferase
MQQGAGQTPPGQQTPVQQVVLCPKCGAQNPAGNKFCANCGAKLQVNTIPCPKCGQPVAEGAKFCPNCGAAMADAKKCSSCGADVKADAKFCAECGKPT